MANCVYNFLRGLCSFVVGSLRMILFFGCLLAILAHTISLVILIKAVPDNDLQLPSGKAGFSDVLMSLGLLLLSFLGAYGSFYRHHPSIKAFSLLTAFSTTVVIVAILYTMSPEAIQKENEKFVDRMRDLASQYNWNANEFDPFDQKEPERAWNKLQKLMCCGIKGPEDWNKYRPSGVPKDEYPSSCCFTSTAFSKSRLCHKSEVFDTGCFERIQQIESFGVALTCLFIGYQLILCILACIVGNFNFERRSPAAQNAEAGQTNRSGYRLPSTEYQRFEGSVYVRQPPVNSEFHQPSIKADLPPLYPNANDVERTTYLGPPPSYGTAT